MSHALIDTVVVLVLFVCGMAWTVYRYAREDRAAFTILAVLSPAIAVFAVIHLLFLVLTKRVQIGPCPVGLAEAEKAVEIERQRLFGGELREPTFARDWQRAYEVQLQHDAESIKRAAERVFVHA